MTAVGLGNERRLPRIGTFRPGIDAEKCLLSRTAFSKCQACADACPAGAILCDEEGLGTNEEACVGCGLCVPACPEAAIASPFEPQLRDHDGTKAVFVACEAALSPDADNCGRDSVPCLHMLGLGELEAIRRKGAELVVIACGDCRTCLPVQGSRLVGTAAAFQEILVSRNIEMPEVRSVELAEWHSLRAPAKPCSPGRVIGRRGFLQLFSRPVSATHGLEQERRDAFGIPVRSLNDVAAFRPVIDAEKCSGCDACVNVCPHGVLTLSKTALSDKGEEEAYAIDAFACTGCKLCVDICSEKAIGVAGLGRPEQTRISLVSFTCRQCGVPGHSPAGTQPQQLCRICARVDKRQRLFQVQD